MGTEAFSYGYSFPYFALSMHRLGLSAGAIGLNASAAGLGILFLGPFVPRFITQFGLGRVVIGQFSLSAISFAALLVGRSAAAWYAIRLVQGAMLASIWTTTEIWLNRSVTDKHRGLILGFSGTWYACCQFTGPLAVSLLDVQSREAVLVGVAPLAAGAVLAIVLRTPRAAASDSKEGEPVGRTLPAAIRLAPALLIAGFAAGFGSASMEGLLPLYGLSHGLTARDASRLVAAFGGGEAVAAVSLGWLARRYSSRAVICHMLLAGALIAALLPLVGSSLAGLLAVLVLAGATIPAVYTLGVVTAGGSFTPDRLAVVSAAFVVTYSLGAAAGPAPIGYLMRAVGPWTLPASIALLCSVSALITRVFTADGRLTAVRKRWNG